MGDNTTNIISRLASRFNNAVGDREKPDFLTRDIGGHFRNNQPYITGYFQVIFGLPNELFMGAGDASTASKWLHSTCENFTPHTQSLNKADIMGQGQIGSSFVTSVTTSREITFGFREYQNMPILNIIRRWAGVFDPFTGVSPLDGNRFIPMNYKGWVAVAITKPVRSSNEALTGDDIEECYIYQGIFPTNIPVDTASSSDITGNDTVQLSTTFSFDGAPLTSSEPGVTDTVVKLLSNMQMLGTASNGESTYGKYWDNGNRVTQWGNHDGNNTSGANPDAKYGAGQKIG